MKVSRPLLAATVLFALFLGTCFGAGLARADTHTPNQPGYWGEECSKIDEYQGGNTWVSPDGYTLVILKTGTENLIFENVQQGQVLTSGKDISHIIVCPPTPTTSTSQPTSTSSTEATTTTTEEVSTTSSSLVETTTTVESSTTSESPPAPTTTAAERTELPYTGIPTWATILIGLTMLGGGTTLIRASRERT